MAEDNNKDKIQGVDDFFSSIPQVYFNAVKINKSKYDFQLIFGQSLINPFLEKPQQFIKPLFLGNTSPQHFKAFVKVLTNVLTEYEKEFGEIPDKAESKAKE